MKKALFSLILVLFATVAVMTTLRHAPVEACPSSNDLVADDLGATTNPSGHFDFILLVESWGLTFTPLVLNLSPESTGNANVTDVEYTPASTWVQPEGCEFGPPDDPYEIAVDGELIQDSQQGNVNTKVLLTAGGTTNYSEPWATYIPPAS